jgi:hypothetical protein
MEASQLDETISFLSVQLWAISGGRAYTFEEYHSWLKASGFISVHQLSERLVSAAR